jgi:hypothetical protein
MMSTGKPAPYVKDFGISGNERVLEIMDSHAGDIDIYAIEVIQGMGQRVGGSVFNTQLWAGRFRQNCPKDKIAYLLTRRSVKSLICKNQRVGDSEVRKSIIDLFGGYDAAIGTSKHPGPIYGVARDIWSAIAIGITALRMT